MCNSITVTMYDLRRAVDASKKTLSCTSLSVDLVELKE